MAHPNDMIAAEVLVVQVYAKADRQQMRGSKGAITLGSSWLIDL